MSTKSRTKEVSIPTRVKLIKLLDYTGGLRKISGTISYGKDGSTFQTLYNDDGVWKSFDVYHCKYDKSNKKVLGRLSNRKTGDYIYGSYNCKLLISDLYVITGVNRYGSFNIRPDNMIQWYYDIIGTRRLIYSDRVEHCGQSFSYERPYMRDSLQYKLGNRHKELRQEFRDDPVLIFCFESVDYFKRFQSLLVDKYNVVGDQIYDKNKNRYTREYEPMETFESFPTKSYKHLDDPIEYPYVTIDLDDPIITGKWARLQGYVGEHEGKRSFLSHYRKEYIGINSDQEFLEVEKKLDRYMKYIRRVRGKWIGQCF